MPVTVSRNPLRRSSPAVRILLVVAVVSMVLQAASLVRRVGKGSTDFSVFYNTSVLLAQGEGEGLYRSPDAETGWMRAIPPFGQTFFQPLVFVDKTGAALAWSIANLLLLVLAAFALRGFLSRLERRQRIHSGIWLWSVIILWLLAGGSLQVGQISVLFVACWIFALNEASKRREFLAGWLWAIPAAIKIYPLLMFAAPLWNLKRRRLIAVLCGLGVCFLLPTVFYGARAVPLTSVFFDEVVFDPHGRVAESQTARSTANQGLDAVLMRLMTYDAKFHGRKYPNYAHLNLPRQTVVSLANAVRLVLLGVTAFVAWRWQRAQKWRAQKRRIGAQDFYAMLQIAALWSCTLFLIMPGAKSRYAIYAFLGFLPLLVMASALRRCNEYSKSWALGVFITVCVILVASAVPGIARAYNAPFIGAFALWTANISLLRRDTHQISLIQKKLLSSTGTNRAV